MKTPETLVPSTPIDAAHLATLGGRSELLARMMRTGVRAGATATGAVEGTALRFASYELQAPALRFSV